MFLESDTGNCLPYPVFIFSLMEQRFILSAEHGASSWDTVGEKYNEPSFTELPRW